MALSLLHRQSLLLRSRGSCRQKQLLAVRAQNTPAMDIMMGSQRMSVLENADRELQNLCSSKATPEEQAKCWEVWKFYHDEREQAVSGGEVNTRSLDNLERLVYEVAYTGGAEQLYRALRVQHNMAKRAAAPAAEPQDKQTVLDGLRTKALELFAQMDTDGNGVIDREEFLDAMHLLHRELGESEMEMVFSCMDSHGYITPEQFVGIVQAEELCDPACDAEVLRHIKHASPNWWSEAPHCITDV